MPSLACAAITRQAANSSDKERFMVFLVVGLGSFSYSGRPPL
jgi:hypothetical protein